MKAKILLLVLFVTLFSNAQTTTHSTKVKLKKVDEISNTTPTSQILVRDIDQKITYVEKANIIDSNVTWGTFSSDTERANLTDFAQRKGSIYAGSFGTNGWGFWSLNLGKSNAEKTSLTLGSFGLYQTEFGTQPLSLNDERGNAGDSYVFMNNQNLPQYNFNFISSGGQLRFYSKRYANSPPNMFLDGNDLTVEGEVKADNIVIKSPNGTNFRITVDNNGNITAVQI